MGFEIKTVKADISGEGSSTRTTRFNEQIQKCFVGISRFQMTFGDDDHHVKELSASINKSSINQQEIMCTAGLCFKDDSNHHGYGNVEYCIAALTGVDNADYVMQSGLKKGDTFERGHGTAQISVIGLGGFGFSYSDGKDHHVKKIAMSVFDSSNTLGATGSMEDGSGHSSAAGTVQETAKGCYLGYFGKSDNLKLTPFTLGNGETVNFNGDINNYGIIITGFDISFGNNDHHVKYLEVGARLNINGLIEGIVTMRDNSGHNQSSDAKVSGYAISYQCR